jgi:hypothetical protein
LSLALPSLKEEEAKPPIFRLRDIVISNHSTKNSLTLRTNQGLIVVGLRGGILSATKAFIWAGIKIRKLYVCGISDSEARTLAVARLEVLSKMFSNLSVAHNGSCPLFFVLPHDIVMIMYRQEVNWGLWTLSLEGFHVKGFIEQPGGHRDCKISALQWFSTE